MPFHFVMHSLDVNLMWSFFSKGKFRALNAFHQSEHKYVLTNGFPKLGNKPSRLSLDQINILEKIFLEIYAVQKVDSLTQARLDKFLMSTKNNLRKLPPSREALFHRTKRACCQTGYLWRELIDNFVLPDPKSWGWEKK